MLLLLGLLILGCSKNPVAPVSHYAEGPCYVNYRTGVELECLRTNARAQSGAPRTGLVATMNTGDRWDIVYINSLSVRTLTDWIPEGMPKTSKPVWAGAHDPLILLGHSGTDTGSGFYGLSPNSTWIGPWFHSIYPPKFYAHDLSFSADGHMNAFIGRYQDSTSYYLATASDDGSIHWQVDLTPYGAPHSAEISPDGRRVVLAMGDVADLYVIDVVSSAVHRIDIPSGRDPAFAPDNQTVAYVKGHTNGSTSLHWVKIDAAGSVIEQGEYPDNNLAFVVRDPVFSPDGRFLAVSRGSFTRHSGWAETPQIYVLDIAAGTWRNITRRPGATFRHPDWQ